MYLEADEYLAKCPTVEEIDENRGGVIIPRRELENIMTNIRKGTEGKLGGLTEQNKEDPLLEQNRLVQEMWGMRRKSCWCRK